MSENPVAYFVRHGQTALNAADSYRGPIDAQLDEKGIQDGKEVGQFLSDKPLGTAYSSDMERVMHTADLAVGMRGIVPSSTPDLRSWNVGKFAGQPKAGNEFPMKMYQDNPDEKIPGGESLKAFRTRVQPRIKVAIMKGIHSGVPSVTFTHSSVIHEVCNVIHGDHEYDKVKPGGVLGVFHNPKTNKLSARAIFKQDKGPKGYGA